MYNMVKVSEYRASCKARGIEDRTTGKHLHHHWLDTEDARFALGYSLSLVL